VQVLEVGAELLRIGREMRTVRTRFAFWHLGLLSATLTGRVPSLRFYPGNALRYRTRPPPGVTVEVDRFPANLGWRATLAVLLCEAARRDEAREHVERLEADEFADLPRNHLYLAASRAEHARALRAGRAPGLVRGGTAGRSR
jgi:hypothetical protein